MDPEEVDTTAQDEDVNLVVLFTDDEDVGKLINAYADARLDSELAEDEAKRRRAIRDVAEARLFEWLERHNMKHVRHERGLFVLNDLAWPRVTDREAVRRWAEAEEPDLLLPNSSRLAFIVREALKGERPMPPGVEPTFSRKVNWRRG